MEEVSLKTQENAGFGSGNSKSTCGNHHHKTTRAILPNFSSNPREITHSESRV